MTKRQEVVSLQRSCSTSSALISSRKVTPSSVHHHLRSSSSSLPSSITQDHHNDFSDGLLIPKNSPVSLHHLSKSQSRLSSLLRSLLSFLSFPAVLPTCKWLRPGQLSLTPALGRKVTGTLFGHRRGRVNFAVQLDPRSDPVLLLELAMSTSSLVKEMSSGLVRIALESEKLRPPSSAAHGGRRQLFQEPSWTMYCNGRKCGLAVSRTCVDFDWHVLSTVRSVSVGAGVIPVVEDGGKGGAPSEGELLYMRARFERVVGSCDSEAFFMMNLDGNGGPDGGVAMVVRQGVEAESGDAATTQSRQKQRRNGDRGWWIWWCCDDSEQIEVEVR